jgi:uridine phosphorylase
MEDFVNALYLHSVPEQVGDRAILVGDRGRVNMLADWLTDTVWVNEDRGLTTVTGTYKECRVTVTAFGMGAPVAVIVLHELARLGVQTILRLGTMMCLPPTRLGEYVLADAAIRGEATSGTYVPADFPAVGDHELGQALRNELERSRRPYRAGLVASYDGFYTQMFPLDDSSWNAFRTSQETWKSLGVLGLDMETSAVLAVGRGLAVRTASLCLATVEGPTQHRLGEEVREESERELCHMGLEALISVPDVETPPDAGLAP